MSRVLISTLVVGTATLLSPSLSISTAHSQGLNINPFPMEKAGTLSVQGPQIVTPEPVEVFAKEAEEEILRLERESAQLAVARERALVLEAQAETARLEKEKKELERSLAARAAADEAQAKASAQEVERLKLKYEALAEQLRQREALAAAQAEAVRLEKEKLKAEGEAKRKRAELALLTQEMEAQRKADAVRAAAAAEVKVSDVESAAVGGNPVGMTPMPVSISLWPLNNDDAVEVSASDLGLVEPSAKVLNDPIWGDAAAPSRGRKISRVMELAAAGLEVIPYPVAEQQRQEQVVSYAPLNQRVAPSYRSANAGESLEDVLRSWSQAEGVGFLWKTTQRFDVQQSVPAGGDYASSVEALLGQFGGGDVRPVGRLKTDPVTGVRVLSVLTE